jgi:hypothetical protein
MLKRKHALVAAAMAAVSPLAAHAATVVFSYGPITYGTTLSASGVPTGTTGTTTPVNGIVTPNLIPVGDYFSVTALVTVTNNANPEFAGAYVLGGGTAQPANLGLGEYQVTIADSSISQVSPIAGTGANKGQPLSGGATGATEFTTVDGSVFNAGTASGIIQSNGTVGDPGTLINPIGGVVNSAGVNPTSSAQLGKLTLGTATDSTGDAGSIFKKLVYKVLATGTTTLTPTFVNSATSVVDVAVASTPGTAPAYASRFVTGSDSVTYLPNLVISNVASNTKIISLTATGSSSGAVGGANFVGGTYNPNTPTAGVINVVGAGSGFVRGELNGIAAGVGSKTGQTGVNFENAAGTAIDPGIEYIGLNVADGANAQGSAQFNTDIQALIADINGATFGFGATDAYATITTGTNDSLAGAPSATQIAALGLNAGKVGAAQYDVVIGIPSVNGGTSVLGLDLTQDTNLPAGLTVTDIAAVPEPASAAGLLIGASGLLLGRRKRKA